MSSRKGNVWKFGDNIDTDIIISAEYLITGDPKELAKHAFEKYRPEFAEKVKEGDVIIAGENFGCGSSREHAPRSLIGAGIKYIIVKSFSGIFYRSSMNIGLPVMKTSEDLEIEEGDQIEVSPKESKIRNLTRDKEYSFEPIPKFLLDLLESGGLANYTKKELTKS